MGLILAPFKYIYACTQISRIQVANNNKRQPSRMGWDGMGRALMSPHHEEEEEEEVSYGFRHVRHSCTRLAIVQHQHAARVQWQ